MVFVSILVLMDVIFLTFHTLLEGLVDNFGVLRVPNKENFSSMSGVRWKQLAIHTRLIKFPHSNVSFCRNWQ